MLLVGKSDTLHVKGENMLGAGAGARPVAVVLPKLVTPVLLVALADPLLAMLEEAAPVMPAILFDAEMPLLLDGAAPASRCVTVVRASDDFFDKQLLLKEPPLYVGNELLEVSLAEVRLVLQVAVAANVLRGDVAGDSQQQRAVSVRLEGGAPRACGAADVPSGDATSDSHLQPPRVGAARGRARRTRARGARGRHAGRARASARRRGAAAAVAQEVALLAMLGKAVPVMIGPLLDAEVLPPLDGAAPASVYVKVMRASDNFFDKTQLLLKKSLLLDGYALPELAAPEVDMVNPKKKVHPI